MSMWRIGREAGRIDGSALTLPDRSATPNPTSTGPIGTGPTSAGSRAARATGGGSPGDLVDASSKWVPGEALALYVVGVTLIGTPNWVWLVVGVLLAPALVLLGAFTSAGSVRLDARVGARVILALVAMLIWSLTVPVSGWHEWGLFRDGAVVVALAAVVVGLPFGLVAESVIRWADNGPPRRPRHARGDAEAAPASPPSLAETSAEHPPDARIEPQPMHLPSIPPMD